MYNLEIYGHSDDLVEVVLTNDGKMVWEQKYPISKDSVTLNLDGVMFVTLIYSNKGLWIALIGQLLEDRAIFPTILTTHVKGYSVVVTIELVQNISITELL